MSRLESDGRASHSPSLGELEHLVASAANVSKAFGATRALQAVDFAAAPGEVHALVGENGAGKSTLVRILSGVHQPDEGTIEIGGRVVRLASPKDAIAAGVVTIPQELRLVPALSIAENMTLGSPPLRRLLGIAATIDRAAMHEETREQLAALELTHDPAARVDSLSFAERQLVAIAKALRQRCSLLILDEPTAALEAREIDRLFAILARMKAEGRAIIYVSHRLDEVVRIADRCTVLRDGRVVASWRRGAFGVRDIVEAMTGRAGIEVANEMLAAGAERLADADQRADAVSVRAREVVCLAGLLGSGTSRVLRRLFGVEGATAVRVDGEARRIASPVGAIAAGIGMVPGERRLGLVMGLSVADNILLPSLHRLHRHGRIDRAAGRKLVDEMMETLDIRPRNPGLRVSALSGGNQQKVILAKWLAREVGVLLLDEPTQGVDVAAKAQIHAHLRAFAARGGGVLVSSSDVAEIQRLCDSVLALRNGAVVARLSATDGLDDARLHAAIGG